MNKTIKTPATVQELFRTAISVEMMPSEFIDFLDDALGHDWWDREPEEITLRDVPEGWNPHLNESQRPAPGIVPPGFTPFDSEWDMFVGKSIDGERWTIKSEWVLHTKVFSLTFWAHDDNPMSADETREYAAALLEMSSYITTMENIMATDTEV